ncbi:MAG TPA: ribonuclease P protein component [Pseudonocardia sp.]|nr:ribonuclease P protein component [Pseudonocardia sp.]
MLPAKARLTDRDDFTTVVRRGRRSGRTLVVMHVLLPEPADPVGDVTVADGPDVCAAPFGSSRVGFVVSKAVGGSVVRHRVARRLRHLMRDRLSDAPAGSRIVVRALPASANADSASLGADLDRALRGALSAKGAGRRVSRPSSARTPSVPRVPDVGLPASGASGSGASGSGASGRPPASSRS